MSIQLFCLPFAGGNSYAYRGFKKPLEPDIDFIAVDLPGHGRLLRKPLLIHFHEMVDYLFEQIKNAVAGQYALYGHSMGTLLGYAVTQKLVANQIQPPAHLFVSGRQGPAVVSKENDWHRLPHQEFIEKVMAYGGIPPEVAREKELMEMFVPIMRTDFQALSEYRHEQTEPLDFPITVMIGADEGISDAEALAWQDVTTHPITLHHFLGGHFFIFDHIADICAIMSRALRSKNYKD